VARKRTKPVNIKVLVFGKNGQVAKELSRLEGDFIFLDRTEVDLTDPAACAAVIEHSDAQAVINAAAYTAVDKAEEDIATAHLVNGAAPAAMAQAAAHKGIPFVHISTDYVFEGGGETPWHPSDPTGPLGVYGASKREGEEGVIAVGGAYGILRTSWVFSAHGANFVKTMLRLAETRDHLTVVGDQIGGPTPAAGIAAACVAMAEQLKTDPNKAGVYHYSGDPDVSWADFAREIFGQSDLAVTVEDIPTSAYPTPAVRPPNSRLDCATTETVFGVKRPSWKAALAEVLKDLKT
jgi:dTDP-4-dehydrorhamnose reductase